MELMGDATKIRKRGCSPSSSTSSVIQNYRFKRAILVGKRGRGRGDRGGSVTPLPTWRMVCSRSPSVALRAASSPRYPPSISGRLKAGDVQPSVSARKLAATLWELNEVPSPSPRMAAVEELNHKRVGRREQRRTEKVGRSVPSGSFPPHLSDPSHSPVFERMERSGTVIHRRRGSSLCRMIKIDNFDSSSNASFMEVETRSRCQMPSGSSVGAKTRLKDVNNALTTSKELLKIISRMWGHEGQPSSSTSLISAVHAELERARLQINQLIQEEHSDQKEIDFLLRRFVEEKAAWKNKEREVVEAAIESIAGELEVERKLRSQSESLNKKLGKELAETKAAFLKVLKELENEKRTRGVMEQMCDELARNIGEDKAQAAETKRESLRMQEEVQKERQILQIAEALQEERTLYAKHLFEEKNAVVDELKSELEDFLLTKDSKENGHDFVYRRRDGDLAFCRSEAKGGGIGEVEDTTEDGENSAESDVHSIELNTDDPDKNYMFSYSSMTPKSSKGHSIDEEQKRRKSIFNQVARKSTSLLRSVSNVVEWGNHSKYAFDKQVPRRSCGDEIQRHKSSKGLRDRTLPSSRLGLEREMASPSSQRGPLWPSRDPCDAGRHVTMEGSGKRASLEEIRVEGCNSRRSRR